MNDEPTALGSVIDPWHESFYEALRESDPTALAGLFTPDAVFMPPNDRTIAGAKSVGDWFENYLGKFKIEDFIEIQRQVFIADQWAFEYGSHSVKLVPKHGGRAIIDEVRFLHVWQLQSDRRWRLSRMMWNSAKPVSADLAQLLADFTRPPKA